jgi:hypothetical protein
MTWSTKVQTDKQFSTDDLENKTNLLNLSVWVIRTMTSGFINEGCCLSVVNVSPMYKIASRQSCGSENGMLYHVTLIHFWSEQWDLAGPQCTDSDPTIQRPHQVKHTGEGYWTGEDAGDATMTWVTPLSTQRTEEKLVVLGEMRKWAVLLSLQCTDETVILSPFQCANEEPGDSTITLRYRFVTQLRHSQPNVQTRNTLML